MMRMLALLIALLGACTTAESGKSLPLADDRPTFLFFYTDN